MLNLFGLRRFAANAYRGDMFMRGVVSIFLGLLLVACSAARTDEVTVRVDRSPAQVLGPLTVASVTEAQALFPSLKVVKSRPSDDVLLFTFPGDGKQDPATLRFTLTPAEEGARTDVRAQVDVPALVVRIAGIEKTLSASKIGAEIERILQTMDEGSSEAATSRLSVILMAMAISTDAKARDKAMAMADNPSSVFGELMGEDDYAQNAVDYAASGGNDPTEFDTPVEENDPTEFDAPSEY